MIEDFAPLVLDPVVEREREHDLRALNLLDTPAEERFDRITRLAGEFFQVASAYVAFIEADRQWFKSRYGCGPNETTRTLSFCQHTIYRSEPLVIPDVSKHPLGREHPMVVGEPFIRFYAGVALTGPRGRKIGTFCLVDTKPRDFGPDQIEQLVAFASLAEREINLTSIIQSQHDLLSTRTLLVETQEKLSHELSDAARYVRRMLPPPLIGEENLEWHFEPSTHLGGDGLGYRRLNGDQLAIYMIDVTGHGLGSALLAVTALEFLRSPAVADFDYARPAQVLERLNHLFQMREHGGKFFSVWYGVFSRSARIMTYANAGHPPALLLDSAGLSQTAPGGPVLGVLPEIKVPEVVLPFPKEAELYLFTDGLYELLDGKGNHGSYDEFVAHLQAEASRRRSIWPTILLWSDIARKRNSIDDDVSLMRFTASI